jgi:release factor glutamine methyltransferase
VTALRGVPVREALDSAVVALSAAGVDTPRLDAEVLLAHALGVDRLALVTDRERRVEGPAVRAFQDAVRRRSVQREPVAYITGVKGFRRLDLHVDGRVLIPRPETETLVEAALDQPRGARVADVGTGSGAIAVAVAVALRQRRVTMGRNVTMVATDESEDALDLARENAVAHAAADGMRFVAADLLPEPLPEPPFDIILANLPYVRSDAIDGLPVAASFEPRTALDGGDDGLGVIGRLLARLPNVLANDGVALLEIGGDQGDAARAAVAAALPGWRSSLSNDLGGLPRVLRVEHG